MDDDDTPLTDTPLTDAPLAHAPLLSARSTPAQRETMRFLEIVLGITIVDEAPPDSPVARLQAAKTREEVEEILLEAWAGIPFDRPPFQ